ncbi:helix-turn-helix domain-containing protein [Burkholderia pseudomultivorans]|uniref:HTH-type transcriptional activator Btr n=1 Tax=Burkholderia pseudomultivorans TaxID=1207504 RepID=A0ABU2E3V2_9BURK|nr:AraC family transcriptional regulator [Burkholderia pseudomultivorans]MDR8732300.1 HTH-type transcriptional activator Btr [Burkholderia pseudomultivorans]MDR8736950.1 HTH-type transcriptional activator Btr [Burkholderia pseudomultivorans]MDR8743155.1 HTH-type transcriptional activator Btr [Burkholderia pseudomultivorans]MDR8754530.1 HTH-type transcriptional activator Btr [Burkholderia pseudomultivorans]MDR8779883.1 HTH-type transcriptional activator Btr [Burkholderia pseudomultivorans]
MSIERGPVLPTSYLGVADAPAVIVKVLGKSSIRIARETCNAANFGITPDHALQDAFAVVVLLRNSYGRTDLWLNGKPCAREHSAQGAVVAYPLVEQWRANMREPFDCLHITLPRAALDDIADEIGVQRIGTLRLPPSENTVDPVVVGLVTSLLPALDNAECASRLFIESVSLALSVHLCHRYGGMSVDTRALHGGLAPWQLKRAREMLLERMDGAITVAELAAACQVSRSHFARAFRLSTGLAPHQWLRKQRVQKAMQLLGQSQFSLTEIALLCGFVDQSHFTRVFKRDVGMNPGHYRRAFGRHSAK